MILPDGARHQPVLGLSPAMLPEGLDRYEFLPLGRGVTNSALLEPPGDGSGVCEIRRTTCTQRCSDPVEMLAN